MPYPQSQPPLPTPVGNGGSTCSTTFGPAVGSVGTSPEAVSPELGAAVAAAAAAASIRTGGEKTGGGAGGLRVRFWISEARRTVRYTFFFVEVQGQLRR